MEHNTVKGKGLDLDDPIPIAQQQVKWKDTPAQSVYANVAAMSINPFDFCIVFGLIDNATRTEVTATPVLKLRLAPEFASVMVTLLQSGLEHFEKVSGGLRNAGTVETLTHSDR